MIAAAGDIACDTTSDFFNKGAGVEGHCRQRATSDLLVGGGFSAVLALGDTQYHVGALNDFNSVFGPTWGRVKPIIRPVPGNHEYSTSNARGYFDYFNGESVDDGPAGPRGKGYYSFDVGAWHLIALNSNCDQVPTGGAASGCAPGSPQERWLQSDLAAHRTSCTLAYWHSPRFNSGLRGNSLASQTFWDVLHRAGTDIVLGGDAHDYERFAPQDPAGNFDPARGIRAFVVGTGGVFFTGWSKVKPNSEVRHNDSFGVLTFSLHPTSYEWRFVPEAGKTFSDSGGGACHGRTASFAPTQGSPAEADGPLTLHDPRHQGGRPPGRDAEARRDLRPRRQRRDPRPRRQRRDQGRRGQRPRVGRQGQRPAQRRRRQRRAARAQRAGPAPRRVGSRPSVRRPRERLVLGARRGTRPRARRSRAGPRDGRQDRRRARGRADIAPLTQS